MFKSRTVFVLGAGASAEAGLPIGSDLKHRIAEKLYNIFELDGRQTSGDHVLVDALRFHTREQPKELNEYLKECRVISTAVAQAVSIDNFLDAHRSNHKLEVCAKLAIIRVILEAESKSKLKFDETRAEGFSPGNLNATWYENLWLLLNEGVRADALERLFENISFIIFNYDRCLEHFLFHSVQNYYRVDSNTAADLVQKIEIAHPYGVVGKLPWQTGAPIPFGAGPDPRAMVQMAGQIKTFTERIEDEAARDMMRSQIQEADTVVFLGLAFHPMNMELITPECTSHARRVFATAAGISNADLGVVHSDILSILRQGAEKPDIDMNLRNDLKCFDLLCEYWRTIYKALS